MLFWFSKEPSRWDGSFVYTQHMYWYRNKKKINTRSSMEPWIRRLNSDACNSTVPRLCSTRAWMRCICRHSAQFFSFVLPSTLRLTPSLMYMMLGFLRSRNGCEIFLLSCVSEVNSMNINPITCPVRYCECLTTKNQLLLFYISSTVPLLSDQVEIFTCIIVLDILVFVIPVRQNCIRETFNCFNIFNRGRMYQSSGWHSVIPRVRKSSWFLWPIRCAWFYIPPILSARITFNRPGAWWIGFLTQKLHPFCVRSTCTRSWYSLARDIEVS